MNQPRLMAIYVIGLEENISGHVLNTFTETDEKIIGEQLPVKKSRNLARHLHFSK